MQLTSRFQLETASMNIGWWLQTVGGILTILGAIAAFIGFIISPSENVFGSIKNIFQGNVQIGNITSINQSGGQTAHTIINAKKPQRTIVNVQKELTKKLKLFPQDYEIKLSNGDSEIKNFANEIKKMFNDAGWNNISFEYNLAGFYPNGITVGVKEPREIAQFIANAFGSAGLRVSYERVPKAEVLTIFIGPNE